MLPLLVKVENAQSNETTELAFDMSPVRIGRNPLNDLTLDQAFVSQWHAIVRFDEKKTQYYDLGSTNGTKVDGARVEKNVAVPLDGDVDLRIGALKLAFSRGQAKPGQLGGRRANPFAKGQAQKLGKTVELGGSEAIAGAQALIADTKSVHGVVTRQKDVVEAFKGAREALLASIREAVDGLPDHLKPVAVDAMSNAYPPLADERAFRDVALRHGVTVGAVATGDVGAASAQLLGAFSRHYLPRRDAPSNPAEAERFVARLAEVLDAYSQAFIELRKGYQQFGSEMAVRMGGEPTPLDSAKTPEQVLGYLVDWAPEADGRIQQLISAFADIMIHQVALLNGMMEGAKSLLSRLSPQEVEHDLEKRPAGGLWGMLSFLGAFRAASRWRRYEERFRSLTEEDRILTATIFGNEFARAYATVAGEKFDESQQKLLKSGSTGRLPSGQR